MKIGDADARGAGAENHDALIPQQRSADAHRGNRGRQRDRAGALQIVAESAELAAISFEDAARIAGRKILPLQQGVRKQPRGGLDVSVDEGVVAFAANPRMPVSRIHRIVAQALAVGAHVDHHRNHARRIDPARRRIDRQLADGDFDSADAPIADAEDLLGIGGQDQIDIAGTGAEISERLLDPFGMIDRKIHAAGTPAFVMVLLHRQADRAVVDDRDHLAQVLGEQAEEQHLIAVVERGQIDVLAQRIRQPLVLGVSGGDLSLQRADDGRQQTVEAQGSPVPPW